MPPNYYHLKFELYATPDPTASGENETDHARDSGDQNNGNSIWVPTSAATIFDDLPSHPRNLVRQSTTATTTLNSWPEAFDGSYNGTAGIRAAAAEAAAAANCYPTKIIDCGAQRGKAHDGHGGGGGSSGGGNIVRLSERQFRARARRASSPPPKVSDGIGPETAVRDWRFGRIRIESFDLVEREEGQSEEPEEPELSRGVSKMGIKEDATPAVSLGPNLGGVGQATRARYLPLETKNTEAGWGIVHLYREGDETNVLRGLPDLREGENDGGEGNSRGADRVTRDEEGTILCIPAVPSYMSPSDFLGFIGEKWRGDVSHYRMIMTSRMNRYMVLMKFRDRERAMEWRKEFDGKPFDSVEVGVQLLPQGLWRIVADCGWNRLRSATLRSSSPSRSRRRAGRVVRGRPRRAATTAFLRHLLALSARSSPSLHRPRTSSNSPPARYASSGWTTLPA